MKAREAFYGPNVGYVLELYDRFRQDPESVDPDTRAFFEKLQQSGNGALDLVETLARPATETAPSGNGTSAPRAPAEPAPAGRPPASTSPSLVAQEKQVSGDLATRIVLAARLARSIREYGHLAAKIDPLDEPRPGDPMLDPATHGLTDADLAALPPTIVWPDAGPETGTCLDAINRLREIYSGSLGYEFDHVEDYVERTWLHQVVESGTYRQRLEPDQQRALLRRLTEVEGFERFLHTVFVGQKRFSIEGNDTLVPMLDELISNAAEAGTHEVLMGMAHRGRLNVLAHVLCKPYAQILSEFHTAGGKEVTLSEGSWTITYGWTGDVKYHLGARHTRREGAEIEVQITLADNPSHLEAVDPAVEGSTRAAQERRGQVGPPRLDVDKALPVTIHGDAAFSGEGVVAETLNLSRLEGYQTGGTIRLIVNNQLGFTTDTAEGRSTLYASDLAKGFEVPIVHVNADDPEACLTAIDLAHAYRHRFHRDFLIDLVGYRRWGHNESDEPSFTQPGMYERIGQHPTVRALYAERLAAEGVITPEEAETMQAEVRKVLQKARDEMTGLPVETPPAPREARDVDTSVPADELRRLNEELLVRPESFTPHPKLERVLERRREAIDKPGGIDWALAETLAFASLLVDGTPIRLSGQDTERGTFSQRHLVLHDARSGAEFIPLQHLPDARASFAVYNSPLTEAAVIGFEYGYSIHAPETLVLWEAQYGDFANAGQVLIDQFVASAWAKWRQLPALGMLLPHGYEGQGPDHSSARLERYLQLAAQDNLRIVDCTTAAQYFHLLRLQAAMLQFDRRPLVLMTPKSLLRHPLSGSSLDDLSHGSFHPVLDCGPTGRDAVERLVLCTGKVAIDLAVATRSLSQPADRVAIARVEQLYPFPEPDLRRVMGEYQHLGEVVWLQEEPANMGAWSYMAPRLERLLPSDVALRYVGRSERAATAVGDPEVHAREQREIVEAAFAAERAVAAEA